MTGLEDLRFYLKKGYVGRLRKWKLGRDPREKKEELKQQKNIWETHYPSSTYVSDKNGICLQLGAVV